DKQEDKQAEAQADAAAQVAAETGNPAVAAAAQQEQEDPEWEGEVAICSRPDDDPRQFKNKQELLAILEPAPIAA
ncbi:MAG: hypothetical protein Q4E12_04710, partial [Coriobacteriia bacterium]|nr:hypothetical protein [Coriobacteriia bacterium]